MTDETMRITFDGLPVETFVTMAEMARAQGVDIDVLIVRACVEMAGTVRKPIGKPFGGAKEEPQACQPPAIPPDDPRRGTAQLRDMGRKWSLYR